MAAAQSGDQDAYRRLLEAIEPIIMRYLSNRIRSDDEARDVCQDVLLTVHRARHTYEPGRPFEPWLYSIARSRLVDHLRRERRISRFEVPHDALPEMPGAVDAEGSPVLADLLDRMPASQREAFLMLKVDGLTTEEAAKRAGIKVSALKVRAHRAYRSLRKALTDGDPDEHS